MGKSDMLLQKAIGVAGGDREFHRKGDDYTRSWEYADANSEQMRRKFDNQWVALRSNRVVASGKKLTEVLDQIRQAELPSDEVLILHVSSEDVLTLY